ncbi:MAG: PAS domain-containing protein [Alphaproteobacteria bacterium]|nr:PAS domain-containing protein [Alphaproteobacteria bacterium]
MTSRNDNTDFDLVFTEAEDADAPKTGRLLTRAALLIVALVVIAGALVYWALQDRERQLLGDLKQRTEILASTRAEVLKTWLDGLGVSGERLSRSELFRLFAAEVGLSGGLPPQSSPLAAQTPYMIQAVTEYASQEGLIGVYMVDRRGRAVLASGGAPPLTRAQRDAAVAVYASKKRQVTPARDSKQGLVADVILPVAPPQERNPDKPRTVAGVFVFTTLIQAEIGDILKPTPLMGQGERTRLVQFAGASPAELDPRSQPSLIARSWGEGLTEGQPLRFAMRGSSSGATPVFSSGAWVPGMPWLVVHEIDAQRALQPLKSFTWGVVGFAAVVTLLFVAAFTAFWWHQASDHAQALASQYRDLGSRINAQRRFLENVMGTLTEMVGLKDASGTYVYVNPSFAKAVERSQQEVTGLDDSEVFGRGTAEGLERTDAQAAEAEEPVMAEKVIHLPSGPKHLQFTKVSYREEDGTASGILSVARDVTALRDAEAKRQAAFRQMTRALVKTIETVDPFLAGHTQNVHEVGLAIAEGLGLGGDEVSTIDITAMLAQIGKVSIPKEIVAKSTRLSDAEFEIMKTHVNHAVGILSGVEFGLPVVETLAQIYERLDGSGYPNGASGDEINLAARILGVADVFCARVERRSYREPITAEAALDILAANDDKYDSRVVEALKAYLNTVAGEKFLARIQAE